MYSMEHQCCIRNPGSHKPLRPQASERGCVVVRTYRQLLGRNLIIQIFFLLPLQSIFPVKCLALVSGIVLHRRKSCRIQSNLTCYFPTPYALRCGKTKPWRSAFFTHLCFLYWKIWAIHVSSVRSSLVIWHPLAEKDHLYAFLWQGFSSRRKHF